MNRYSIPACETRTEIIVKNSRFIATIGPVLSVAEAKGFITRLKTEFSDASHNVLAYIIGHGASVIAHCNDDGEPYGTAGRPALAVLRGSSLGDAAVVVTRYFGGTKLGTGGLVRAYSDAVRSVLEITSRAVRVPSHTVMVAVPYSWFERLRLLIDKFQGHILDEVFAADVTVTARFSVERYSGFQEALLESSHGMLQGVIIETGEIVLPVEISDR